MKKYTECKKLRQKMLQASGDVLCNYTMET